LRPSEPHGLAKDKLMTDKFLDGRRSPYASGSSQSVIG
jgi:hypothetical protein